MSEKREPVFTFLLKNKGKKSNKIEIFEAIDFFNPLKSIPLNVGKRKIKSSYRIRVNGRWHPKGKVEFFWRSEIRDLIFRSIFF